MSELFKRRIEALSKAYRRLANGWGGQVEGGG